MDKHYSRTLHETGSLLKLACCYVNERLSAVSQSEARCVHVMNIIDEAPKCCHSSTKLEESTS